MKISVKGEQPYVSVITLNWNTPEMTIECVNSILASDYPHLIVNVIDNGSEEDNVAILKNGLSASAILHPLEKNLGYVGGVNYGLNVAKDQPSNYFLIMNNDTVIDPEAISHFVSCAKRYEDSCIVTGKVYSYDEPEIIQQIGSRFVDKKKLSFKSVVRNERDVGQVNEELQLDMIDDVFWLLPRKVFEDVGYYCNYFWFNSEQADYALRAVDKGYKLIYTPLAKLWHKGSYSLGGRQNNPVREYYNIKSVLMLRYLHISKKDFLIFYIGMLNKLVVSSLKLVVKLIIGRSSNPKVLLANWVGVFHFFLWTFKKTPDQGAVPKILR